jgi:hypothetical protein
MIIMVIPLIIGFFIGGVIGLSIVETIYGPTVKDSQVDSKPKTREEKERDNNWSFQMVWGKCPYCWEEISRGAVRCPKCTANLDPTRNNGK